jgi:hypothetical protein
MQVNGVVPHGQVVDADAHPLPDARHQMMAGITANELTGIGNNTGRKDCLRVLPENIAATTAATDMIMFAGMTMIRAATMIMGTTAITGITAINSLTGSKKGMDLLSAAD